MALLISTDIYDDQAFSMLRSPTVDAASLRGVLEDPEIGGYTVRTVSNSEKHIAEQAVDDFFSDASADDQLLLYITGHGVKDDSGRLHFAMRNTRLNRLASLAMSADFVRECMDSSRSRRKVIVLDCCFSGAFPAGLTRRSDGAVDVLSHLSTGGRGSIVITASSALEYAFESTSHSAPLQDATPSLFTEIFIAGLATGEADRDQDGLIDIDELYQYVFDGLRKRTKHQTPQIKIEASGRIYIAATPQGDLRQAEQDDQHEAPWWTADIDHVLFTQKDISNKVRMLARLVDAEYRHVDSLRLIANLDGSERFLNDLATAMRTPAEISYIKVEFTDEFAKIHPGLARIHQDLQRDVGGQHILLVQTLAEDDAQLNWMARYMESRSAASVNICTLLQRPESALDTRFVGFPLADNFQGVIVGYGLSYYGRYNSLPYVATLKKEIYSRSDNCSAEPR